MKPMSLLGVAALLILLLAGCETENERSTRIAERMAEQQSQQNQAMARQGEQLVRATQALVEADSTSRAQLVAIQKDLQQERGKIAGEWEELDDQRRQIASLRTWDSALAVAVEGLAALLTAGIPLALCWSVMRDVKQDPSIDALNEVLVLDLVADMPMLLPAPSNRP
ncbi:MAG: hypothetical protein ABI831_24295, partial [Betaproteobacteria bacterium]